MRVFLVFMSYHIYRLILQSKLVVLLLLLYNPKNLDPPNELFHENIKTHPTGFGSIINTCSRI